jgi:hypothetical protein
MTATETPLFVVVLTGQAHSSVPRAVGPFDNYDVAQSFMQTLLDRWQAQDDDVPRASVVRVESDYPGVVVGEL